MATNPYVNKVVYGNQTVLDLTEDTADASDVLQGQTFHDRSGALVTGTAIGGMSYADNGVLGAKNRLPYPYNQSSLTHNGMTFTANSDGTITMNGTVETNKTAEFYLLGEYNTTIPVLSAIDGIIQIKNMPNGCEMKLGRGSASQYTVNDANEHSISIASGSETAWIVLRVSSGTSLSDVTIYPMIRLATDTDDTYQPYAMTNKELTDNKANNTDLDEWTATSQADSNGVVSFTNLDTSLDYKIFYELPSGDSDYSYSKINKNGTTLTYYTNAPSGTVCKLRILK